jgi:diacylglycerol kinase family enzyme
MRARLVLNSRAGTLAGGRQAPQRDEIVALLESAGVTVEAEARGDAPIDVRLRAAVAACPETIWVGGGDGTISAAAGLLAGTGVALGVLPLGTLNHFARDLAIPADWRDAIRALAHGAVGSVDVASVNGHTFINNCSLGSYPEAVRRRDALRRERGHGKWPAMLLASLAVWRDLRRMRLRLATDRGTTELRTPFVLVSNNRYAGPVLKTSLRPSLTEHRLWCYTTREHRTGALLRLAWQALTRRLDQTDALQVLSGAELRIESLAGGIPAAADGEVVSLAPPLQFRIHPGALTVLIPADRAPA